MVIGVELEKPRVEFVAADIAPMAESAQTSLIPDHLGNYALLGFKVDPHNPSSEVRLDTNTEPPTLYLKEALTHTVYGFIDSKTNEFKPYGGHSTEIAHTATGLYTGPGSTLDIN